MKQKLFLVFLLVSILAIILIIGCTKVYDKCGNNKCEEGETYDNCRNDCSAVSSLTHSECRKGTCIVVSGEGSNECEVGSKCGQQNNEGGWSDSKGKMNWDLAVATCADMGEGWRLPTVEELTIALTDQYVNNNPRGFNDDPAIYWTNNADMEEQYQATFARVVGYDSNLDNVYPNALGKTVKITASARCVS